GSFLEWWIFKSDFLDDFRSSLFVISRMPFRDSLVRLGGPSCFARYVSTTITFHVASSGAYTPNARRSAVPPDAVFGRSVQRSILRCEVPKQSSTSTDPGERNARYEVAGTFGLADNTRGSSAGHCGTHRKDSGVVCRTAKSAHAVQVRAAVRFALSRRSAQGDDAGFFAG